MALYRNISGIDGNDAASLKCDDGGCVDVRIADPVEYFRPSQGSGVFPVFEYPYEPIENNQIGPALEPVTVNTAPVLPVPPLDTSMDKKKVGADALILLGLGIVLYMGMSKKDNNTEALLYAGGVGLLLYRIHELDKKSLPVTE